MMDAPQDSPPDVSPDSPRTAAQIRLIEELAANAWPAAFVQTVNGWRLRYTHDVTRRANSVWPNVRTEPRDLSATFRLVEAFYAQYGLPARYQICPAAQPAELDAMLAARGYTHEARTAVQMASVASMVRQPLSTTHDVQIVKRFDESWFAGYCQAEGHAGEAAAVRAGIVRRIAGRTGYAWIAVNAQPVAVGLGVVERGWLGLFCISTHAGFRRRGAAAAIVHGLAQWAQQQHGARHAYVQVMAENAAANQLYGRFGFRTLYHYHYRTQVELTPQVIEVSDRSE